MTDIFKIMTRQKSFLLTTVTLMLLVLISGCSQNDDEPAPEKECRLQRLVNEQEGTVKEYEFNPQTKLLQRVNVKNFNEASEPLLQYYTFEHDAQGRPINWFTFRTDGEVETLINYTYDEDGNLKTLTGYATINGQLEISTIREFFYAENNQITRSIDYGKDDVVTNTFLYTYDGRGNITRLIIYRGSNTETNPQLTINYEYDLMRKSYDGLEMNYGTPSDFSANNIVRVTQSNGYDATASFIYNDQDRPVQRTIEEPSGEQIITLYSYDCSL